MDQPVGSSPWEVPLSRVTTIDVDPAIQGMIVEQAIQAGCAVLSYDSIQSLQGDWSRRAGRELVVIDNHAGERKTIETLRHLQRLGYEGEILTVTAAHERHNTVPELAGMLGLKIAATVARPLDPRMLYQTLRRHRTHYAPISAEEIGNALDAGEFTVAFLPIVSLDPPYPVQGFEALARWHSPVRGLVAPQHFLPPIEDTAIIDKLTDIILAKALVNCAQWRAGGQALAVSVNVPATSLTGDLFVEKIRALSNRHAIAPHQITLEMAESAAMADPDAIFETLQALHECGVRLAMDDFGTGYSSLAQLVRMPLDELKIDRSFLEDRLEAHTVLRAAAQLGQACGLPVTAEGIESESAGVRARACGCTKAQGHYFSRALSPPEVLPWLRQQPT